MQINSITNSTNNNYSSTQTNNNSSELSELKSQLKELQSDLSEVQSDSSLDEDTKTITDFISSKSNNKVKNWGKGIAISNKRFTKQFW